MTKKIFAAITLTALLTISTGTVSAQNAVVQEGEFGIGVGAGHYFGDLNTRAKLNRAKMAASIFFRKNLGNYIAVRVGASFAQLGYSDKYNTHNTYMQTRNLSFNTRVWELALQRILISSVLCRVSRNSASPYITFGAGIFSYDPYATCREESELRPLFRKAGSNTYSSMAICIPFWRRSEVCPERPYQYRF
jgi:hypothetical protein